MNYEFLDSKVLEIKKLELEIEMKKIEKIQEKRKLNDEIEKQNEIIEKMGKLMLLLQEEVKNLKENTSDLMLRESLFYIPTLESESDCLKKEKDDFKFLKETRQKILDVYNSWNFSKSYSNYDKEKFLSLSIEKNLEKLDDFKTFTLNLFQTITLKEKEMASLTANKEREIAEKDLNFLKKFLEKKYEYHLFNIIEELSNDDKERLLSLCTIEDPTIFLKDTCFCWILFNALENKKESIIRLFNKERGKRNELFSEKCKYSNQNCNKCHL